MPFQRFDGPTSINNQLPHYRKSMVEKGDENEGEQDILQRNAAWRLASFKHFDATEKCTLATYISNV